MHYKLLLLLAVGCVTLLLVMIDRSHHTVATSAASSAANLSVAAPNFIAPSVDTQTRYSLYQFKGKTILINFWASWCLPCLYEFPILIELATRHPDRLELMMISVDEMPEKAYAYARGFCMRHGLGDSQSKQLFPNNLNIHILWDKNKAIAQNLFQTLRYPESVIISPQMQLKKKIVGPLTDEDIQALEASLTKSTED